MQNEPSVVKGVVIVEVSEVKRAEGTGDPYVTVGFASDEFGRVIRRNVWGREAEGKIVWERAFVAKGAELLGRRVESISLVTTKIQPQTLQRPDGREVQYDERTFVVFADESVSMAVRRSGSLLEATEAPEPVKALPVHTNGHRAAADLLH